VTDNFNRVFDLADRDKGAVFLPEMRKTQEAMISRKFPDAVFQQALCYGLAKEYLNPESRIMGAGAYEDPCVYCLQAEGYHTDLVDPAINGLTLQDALKSGQYEANSYDVVISCSVMEHVPDDLSFMESIRDFLKVGGVAIMTVDYKWDYVVGEPIPPTEMRRYTESTLKDLTRAVQGIELVGGALWGPSLNEFNYGGCRYSFAGLHFRKVN
jgi:SAM-dependent methyltransferase